MPQTNSIRADDPQARLATSQESGAPANSSGSPEDSPFMQCLSPESAAESEDSPFKAPAAVSLVRAETDAQVIAPTPPRSGAPRPPRPGPVKRSMTVHPVGGLAALDETKESSGHRSSSAGGRDVNRQAQAASGRGPSLPSRPRSEHGSRPQTGSSRLRPVSGSHVRRHSSAQFIDRDYDVVERLGEGSFGKVDLVRLRTSGDERVCKVVSTKDMKRDEVDQMREEVRVLRSLDHPSIVKIFEYAEDKTEAQLILILEYIPGGSCGSLLKKRHRQPLPEPLVAKFVRQMLQAIAYSHGKGVVHRDLKPEHMMLTRADPDSRPDCKIIDFGMAARYRYSSSSGIHTGALTQRVGTPAYMAPEVVDREVAYTSKADIWSAGVSALELLTGKRPFAGDSVKRTYERIRLYSNLDTLLASVGNPFEWHALSSGARDFLRALLEAEPGRRPAASDALQKSWLGQDPAAGDRVRSNRNSEQARGLVTSMTSMPSSMPSSAASSARPSASAGPTRSSPRGRSEAPAPICELSEERGRPCLKRFRAGRRASTESPHMPRESVPDSVDHVSSRSSARPSSQLALSSLASRALAHLGG